MNYVIIHGKVTGKWGNGKTNDKRGLNLVMVDGLVSYKAMLWQDEAEWADEQIATGDEIYIRGQISGLWINKKKVVGVEISGAEILSINSWNDVKADLIKKICTDTANSKDEKSRVHNKIEIREKQESED